MAKFFDSVKSIFNKCVDWVKGVWAKFVEWFKEVTKNIKWKEVWDKCTTGLLILVMVSPILILAWIFIWFVAR